MKSSRLCKADYNEVKQRLSMRAVAEHYGFCVNRQGFCLCPFHADSHPSMKIYGHDKGFYCFTCQRGGDVVNFTGALFGLTNEEACKKLIEDFSLPVKIGNLSYREKRERQKAQAHDEEILRFKQEAQGILRKYRQLLCDAAHTFSSLHFDEALRELSVVEYRIECIEKYPEEYYKDRKAVERLGEIQRRIDKWNE